MVDKRVEVVARLNSLEEAAAPLVTFLQNPNVVQELRADKQYNLQMLNECYQIDQAQFGNAIETLEAQALKVLTALLRSSITRYLQDLTLKESETIAVSILK